jgi:uncharacterized protein (TIRG00374 family)
MHEPLISEKPKDPAEIVAEPYREEELVPGIASYRLARSILIFAVVGASFYAGAVLLSNYREAYQALAGFPLDTLALVLGMVVVGWILRGWRFYYYLQQKGPAVPLGYSIAVFLAGFALTGTPGKLGEAVKGVFLKGDYGIPVTRVVGILVVERLMDLLGVLLLGCFSFLLFSRWTSIFLICAAVVVAGGIFICMESVYRPILERAANVRFLSWISEKTLGILLSGKELMTPRIFVVGLVVSAISWGMESVSFYFIMKGLNLHATLLEANFVYCFSTIVGALSMLPGGIGGTEMGMIGLLAVKGISYTSGLPAVILIRVCTLWLAIGVGVAFMSVMLARAGRRLQCV